jgi:hypothetical protein
MMALFPSERPAAFTVSVAVDPVPAAPEIERLAIPRETFPKVKTTVPVGKTLPEAGFTVAVRMVDAF